MSLNLEVLVPCPRSSGITQEVHHEHRNGLGSAFPLRWSDCLLDRTLNDLHWGAGLPPRSVGTERRDCPFSQHKVLALPRPPPACSMVHVLHRRNRTTRLAQGDIRGHPAKCNCHYLALRPAHFPLVGARPLANHPPDSRPHARPTRPYCPLVAHPYQEGIVPWGPSRSCHLLAGLGDGSDTCIHFHLAIPRAAACAGPLFLH